MSFEGASRSAESALARDALVLNRAWLPIASTPVRNALRLLYSAAAQVIEPESYATHDFESWARLDVPPGEDSISTVRSRLRVPEVIVLSAFSGVPRHALPFTRQNLLRRDGDRCQYCGRQAGHAQLSVDHVVPRAAGGETSWENCVVACRPCNHRKGSRLLAEAGMVLLREPRAPRWSPIFEVSAARKRDSWRRFLGEQQWGEAS